MTVATLPAEAAASSLPYYADTPDDLVGELFAAHTKSRQEKALVRDLAQREIGYYLPLAEKLTQTSQRRRYITEEPLFAGYVFFAGDDHTPAKVMGTGRVCQTIRVPDQPKLRSELCNLFKAWQANPRMEVMPGLVQGKMIRVAQGPLEGVEGIIIERKRGAVLVVQASFLGQAAIQIDAVLCEEM